jgi:hypothetical protein
LLILLSGFLMIRKHRIWEHDMQIHQKLTAKTQVFWDMTLCHWAKCSWQFYGSLFHHLQVLLEQPDPSGEGTMIPQNIRNHLPKNAASHPRRTATSATPLWEHQICRLAANV